MKINFEGNYKEVSRLVNSPLRHPQGEEPGSGFVRLLSSLLPKSKEVPETAREINKPKEADAKLKELDKGPMASIMFESPEIKPPDLGPVIGPLEEPPTVNEHSGGVKSPTLLEVRKFTGPLSNQSAKPQAETITGIKDLVSEAGKRHGVDPVLSMAVIAAESSFNTHAISSDGQKSKGLFQLLDSTGRELHSKLGYTGHYDPHNAPLNVDLGVGYLRYLHDIFSNSTDLPNNSTTVAAANYSSLEKLSLAAFNAGEGRVASAQDRAKRAGLDPADYASIVNYLPETTVQYVTRVLTFKDEFESGFNG